LRDAVAFLRNPFSSNEEGKTRKPGAHETEPETELLNRAFVVFERFQTKKDVFARFETLKYRVMAAFGKNTERIFTKTIRTVNEIFVAANMLGTHYWQRQGRVPMEEEEFRKHLKEMQKNQAIFWDMRSPDDAIKRDLDAILSDLESVTAPAFENELSLYGWMKKKLFKMYGWLTKKLFKNK